MPALVSAVGLRRITLTTPPMASAPYSEDIGPRITSMRSMAAIGIEDRSKSLA